MTLRRSLTILGGAVLLSACVGAAAEHESIADEAYADGRYADALVEYRLAFVGGSPTVDLRRKAAAAALKAGALEDAAAEFAALGAEGSESAADEAADGLVRVAHAAIGRGDQVALAAALGGLQTVAPGRALGAFAGEMAATAGDVARTPEALRVLIYAAAAAPNARSQDSVMYTYGSVLRRLGRCQAASDVFESLVRRQRDPMITRDARWGLVRCALAIGQRALDGGQPSLAEQWFERAATSGGNTPETRSAYLGLGDVRFALGDVRGAIEAYERARVGLRPGDSVYAIVSERLNRIAAPDMRVR